MAAPEPEPEPEPIAKQEAESDEEEEAGGGESRTAMTRMSRKEKRKAMKKMKRKQLRKEVAAKEKEEEEKRLNDPEEQRRVELMEAEEAARRERELKEFEERETAWIQAMEEKKRKEEEERERQVLEAQQRAIQENECDDDDDWEYVEEGPAEIIWQGNEIIVRKKKVRVPKNSVDQLNKKEDADRPTSNPLPPQSEAFSDYQNASLASAQQLLENVAQQVPNFGTEQDKAHCPFHLKTGACRFGQHCSRVHFYPDKSCTLLMKNMYSGPGLAWEQDEGLECTDEEVEQYFEEFYEDVHTEFLKFGEIVNFKVCKNGSSHLRGNVYVHYKTLESAVVAYQSVNGRYFAGKQVKCEFVNVTRWKVAICGEYMKSRLKTCSRGTACNFVHCFRNPGGDYEWADWDKPPPKYWMKKMASLFGYSDESMHEKQREQEHFGQPRKSVRIVTMDDRDHSSRSRSREVEHMTHRSCNNESDVRESSHRQRHRNRKDDQKRVDILDDESGEDDKKFEDRRSKRRRCEASSDEGWTDGDRDGHGDSFQSRTMKSSKHRHRCVADYRDHKKRTLDAGEDWEDGDRDRRRRRGSTKIHPGHCTQTNSGNIESSVHQGREKYVDNLLDRKKRTYAIDSIDESSGGDRYRSGHHSHRRKRIEPQNEVLEFPSDHGNDRYDSGYSSDHGNHKERGRSAGRKHSRHGNELSNISDDQGEPKKRDRMHRHSQRRSRSSKEIIETESLDKSLKSYGDHESIGSGQCVERYGSRCNFDENTDMDNWEPEKTPEKDLKSRRNSNSVDGYESSTPEHYDGRERALHLSPKNFYQEHIDKRSLWETVTDASTNERKVGSKSSSNDKKSGEKYDDSRSRGSSRSSRKKHSKKNGKGD